MRCSVTKRQQRIFSTEFKIDTTNLVLDQGYSISEDTTPMDIDETALQR